jgi:drug/metabolite transporter (DMT)-like permease
VRGILLSVATGIMLSAAAAIGKQVTAELPPFQVAFLRGVFLMAFLAPWLMRVGLRDLRPHRPGIHIIRALVSAAAVMLWFWAIKRVPLTDLVALEFTSPLFVLAAAIFFLGEESKLWRWSALGVGFAGSMIILRPGINEISIGNLAVLASAVCFAANRVLAKLLTRTDSPTTLVAVRGILMPFFMLPPAIYVWQWPSAAGWGWLLLLGALGTVNQFTATWAIKLADLGAIEPVNFLRLIWAALIGFFIFSEMPSTFTLIGGAIMIASVVYITQRERRAK